MISWAKYNHRNVFHQSKEGEDTAAYGSTSLCGIELYDYRAQWPKKDYYMPYDCRPTCKNCKRVRKARRIR